MLNEFYRIAFRNKLYTSIGELQDDLDEWIRSYNEESYYRISLSSLTQAQAMGRQLSLVLR
jgi:hypothetical protein